MERPRALKKNHRELIDPRNIPRHVALIMDGNGRWANRRSLPRMEGHRRGAGVIEPLIDAALDLRIPVISLFAFSTENWTRPAAEVRGLWELLEYFFSAKIDLIRSRGVRVHVSGARTRLQASTRRIIESVTAETAKFKNITLNFCINYGGRQEIVDGINRWLVERKDGEKLTEKRMAGLLYTPSLPDVDLMIRTSGEYRISNFMLWQLAYAELVFMKVLWPDFKPRHLYEAVYEYQQRDRRFGAL